MTTLKGQYSRPDWRNTVYAAASCILDSDDSFEDITITETTTTTETDTAASIIEFITNPKGVPADATSPFDIFTHELFGSLRGILKDGKPWFVAKDVAEALGYADTDQAVRAHCKHAKIFKPVKSTGLDFPSRGLTLIPESDVYRLIIRSKLPSAERFEAWVMEEVLPAIRKTGGYLIDRPDDSFETATTASSLSPSNTFTHEQFGQLRTVIMDGDGNPWFVAKDVANALGYRMASDMTRHLDDDEKGTRSVRTPGGSQEMAVISEAGLYSAVIRSDKPEAKAFKRWVTHEVLPAIRKTGGYLIDRPDDTFETIMARAAQVAQDTIKRMKKRS